MISEIIKVLSQSGRKVTLSTTPGGKALRVKVQTSYGGVCVTRNIPWDEIERHGGDAMLLRELGDMNKQLES